MSSSVQILGVAGGGGAGTVGAERGPDALRARGLVGRLEQLGRGVSDLGDVPGGDRIALAHHDLPALVDKGASRVQTKVA